MSEPGRTLAATDPAAALPAETLAQLRAAFDVLEKPSLAARLAAAIGAPVDMLAARLPAPLRGAIDDAVRRALVAAAETALRTAPSSALPGVSSKWMHRGLAAATGMAGGAFGLPGTLVELPFTTTLLLRQIAAIAAEQGEDLAHPEAAAECLKVFALSGRSPSDDAVDSAYFAVRLALAEALSGAAGRVLLPGFIGQIAARFGVPVSVKVSAQMAPLIGAATGAAINLAFLEHFRGIAHGHFSVRRLERQHGAARLREAWTALRATRDERFIG